MYSTAKTQAKVLFVSINQYDETFNIFGSFCDLDPCYPITAHLLTDPCPSWVMGEVAFLLSSSFGKIFQSVRQKNQSKMITK